MRFFSERKKAKPLRNYFLRATMHEAREKIKVGVLRGGPSPEYDVSLASGRTILEHLPRQYYEPVDIYIAKNGDWHEGGLAKQPENILRRVDVVWNSLHGNYGEDGTVQQLLERLQMPFTGSDSFSAALSMNKAASKKIYRKTGLKTPFGIYIDSSTLTREDILNAYHNVPAPLVVKPVSSGSSFGVKIVHSRPELEEAVVAATEYSPGVLIEEYIRGKEATCGVIDDFREREVYTLMPIEIRHSFDKLRTSPAIFDYNSKYGGETIEVCPGNFSYNEKQLIEEMARAAHRELGLRHYSRSDFRVHPTRGVFILETNSLPGLTEQSLIPKALHAAGVKISDFLHHIITLTLRHPK